MRPFSQGCVFLALCYAATYVTADSLGPGLLSELDTIQLVLVAGFDVSKHDVITKDNATISMYRIPGKKDRDTSVKPKGVVLMCPGITNSAYIWVSRGQKSMAYYISEGNYEVWVADMRGQSDDAVRPFTYVLGPKKWYFTQDDQALFDMPAMVDYIRRISGFDQIHIIGFSMGTTVTFQLLSALPEYNDKVKSFTALAPAVYVKRDSSPAKKFNELPKPLGFILIHIIALVGAVFGFIPLYRTIIRLAGRGSLYNPIIQKITLVVAQFILGKDPELDKIPFDLLLTRITPLPTFTFLQYYQATQTGKFQRFNYGLKFINRKVYGQPEPPVYDLTKLKVPVFYVTGKSDGFQSPANSKYTTDQLKEAGTLYQHYRVNDAYVDHFGFLANKKAFELINEPVWQFIEAVTNGTKADDFHLDGSVDPDD